MSPARSGMSTSSSLMMNSSVEVQGQSLYRTEGGGRRNAIQKRIRAASECTPITMGMFSKKKNTHRPKSKQTGQGGRVLLMMTAGERVREDDESIRTAREREREPTKI